MNYEYLANGDQLTIVQFHFLQALIQNGGCTNFWDGGSNIRS